MSGYYGFPSKLEYEKYYSGPLPQWELDAMESYSREAEEERESLKMSNPTKGCNLTEDEVKVLLQYHARQIAQSASDYDDYIDRIKYLNSRIKSFKEPEIKTAEANPAPAPSTW